ncbi:hypothetical protein IU431_04560 [Nocardia otitidiscaviarum]|uniref:hypothetical protein n=1 Tax=Nocardia otitidiscaviarum TaxID=1823 RepID=UPI0011C0280C|nr:hypothetical protein [Nocardia otitidiscaviarum]MBF6483425.1 hypothetical protein [Nocardia otitidiscaviarum]
MAAGVMAMAAMVFGGAGSAAADLPSSQVDMRCVGISPNIVDLPYSSQVIVSYLYDESGFPYITVHTGASLWGYHTTATLRWTNLATDASGTVTGDSPVSSFFGTGGTVYFREPTGPGPVRLDLTVVNSGLVPVPPVNCSGTIDIH